MPYQKLPFGFNEETDKQIVIFHGGCSGCTQQLKHGVEFCSLCQYFDAEWDKPNMNNRPKTEAEKIREEIKKKQSLTN